MHCGNRIQVKFVVLLIFACSVSNFALAQTSEYAEREVSFRSGSIELKGTLMMPIEDVEYPAVVFLHGSGPVTRAGARDYAQEFAKLGLASLFFDKRGCGSSGGSWLTSSLDDLAGDALSAVEFLKQQENIDSKRIGFWGVSQAGWVATLATSKSPQDIAFLILVSGGGASPRESELFSYKQRFNQAELSDAEKSEALEVLDSYFHYLATGEGRSNLLVRLQAAKNSRWYPHAQLDRILPSEENRLNWSWVATWDPKAHMTRIKCPVLLMFGDLDSNHPTILAVERWKEGMARAENDQATFMIFPGAGHGIRMRDGYTGTGAPPFADGYEEIMVGWLWRHVMSHHR